MKLPVYKYSYDKDPIGYICSPDITFATNDVFFLPLVDKTHIEFRIVNGDEGARAILLHKYELGLLVASEFYEPLDASASAR